MARPHALRNLEADRAAIASLGASTVRPIHQHAPQADRSLAVQDLVVYICRLQLAMSARPIHEARIWRFMGSTVDPGRFLLSTGKFPRAQGESPNLSTRDSEVRGFVAT